MNFAEFMDKIAGYESDTFSASAERINVEQKIKMANKMLDIFFENHVDGVLLTEVLEEVKQDG